MKVNEIFYSIQGEGQLVGLPTIFIRFTGCNLRCTYCDTTYAYTTGKEMSISDILSKIKKYPSKRICLTGGEPLLQKDLLTLIKKLKNYSISIETNGSLNIKPYTSYASISLDIKSPSSGHKNDMYLENLNLLTNKDQVKFIVKTQTDINYAIKIIKKYSLDKKTNVFINPVYGTTYNKIVSEILKLGLDIRVGTQLHKIIWGNKKGV